MVASISVLSNLKVLGALILDGQAVEFPVSPVLGTLAIKNESLYAYIKVAGIPVWYPIVKAPSSYVHTQGLPSLTWTVNHNLNTTNLWYQIQDADGQAVSPASFVAVDDKSFIVTFSEAITGTVVVVGTSAIDVPSMKASLIELGSVVKLDTTGIYVNGQAVVTADTVATVVAQQVDTKVAASAVIVKADAAANLALALISEDAKIALKLDSALVGAANGVVPLDASTKIAALYLPSYVDDVIEYANLAAFPVTGESGKIYISIAANAEYRWTGSSYLGIVASPGTTDAVPEGTGNLYFTVSRALNSVLSGLSILSSVAIAATDSVVGALGKLQAQITTLASSLASKASLGANTFTAGQAVNIIDKGTVTTGTSTFSFAASNVQRLQVGGALTVATSNWPASGTMGEMLVELVNGAAFVITWPAIRWVLTDGTNVTTFASNGVTLQASGTDWVLLWTRDGGATVYGKIMR